MNHTHLLKREGRPAALSIWPTPRRATKNIRTFSGLVRYMRGALWHEEPNECCWIIPLDLKKRVMYDRPILVHIGTTDTVTLDPLSIFRAALVAEAEYVVVVHNHPSGDSFISKADRAVTRRLRKAGEIIRIPVTDSIVLSEGGCRSIITGARYGIKKRRSPKAARGRKKKSGGTADILATRRAESFAYYNPSKDRW